MSPSAVGGRRRHGRGGQHGHEPRVRVRSREMRALELSTQGWTQPQIAMELHITQPAVSKILRRVEERALREQMAVVGRQKARHTLRLEHLYAEAIRAWERSKVDTTRRRQRRTQGTNGDATMAELVVENEHGDPRYLEEARKALADATKLWGLDAPQKIDVTVPHEDEYLDDLSEQELRERGMQLTVQLLKMSKQDAETVRVRAVLEEHIRQQAESREFPPRLHEAQPASADGGIVIPDP